jgi:hypothetical protein
MSDNGPEIKINGWHYDPIEQAWTAKTGPNTWSIVKGDLTEPPTFKPMDARYWEWMDSGTDLPWFLWEEVQSGKLTVEQAHAEQEIS